MGAATSELRISILQPAEILLNSFKAPAERPGLSGDEFFFRIVLAYPARRRGPPRTFRPNPCNLPPFLKGGVRGLQEHS